MAATEWLLFYFHSFFLDEFSVIMLNSIFKSIKEYLRHTVVESGNYSIFWVTLDLGLQWKHIFYL